MIATFPSPSEAQQIANSHDVEFCVEWVVETEEQGLDAVVDALVLDVAARGAGWQPHSYCGPTIGPRALIAFWRPLPA